MTNAVAWRDDARRELRGRQSRKGAAFAAGTLVIAMLLAGLALPSAAGSAPQTGAAELTASALQAPRKPKVICIVDWDIPAGAYRTKPKRCTFHVRGEFPLSNANTYSLARIRWTRWGPRKARGKGKVSVTTYGWAKARVELKKPRTRCGQRVFTQLRLRFALKQDGGKRVFKPKIPIDNCLR